MTTEQRNKLKASICACPDCNGTTDADKQCIHCAFVDSAITQDEKSPGRVTVGADGKLQWNDPVGIGAALAEIKQRNT